MATQHVSPHINRHSTAMHMLQAGVNITVVALRFGHDNRASLSRGQTSR
ncbi:MAG: tyrosine-type recombinase/integrase [Pseudomonadales bacterium]|nr:tyrosine-type recombinase/integrase [Pseudomonadales bacterium]MCP5337403.1 tyrosine-type recombinase/integrase [Pseudomonadales bacterium]